mgnify:FL=1
MILWWALIYLYGCHMSEKLVQTVLKVHPKVRDAFKRLAKAEGRTMSGMLTVMVLREANRRRASLSAARSAPTPGHESDDLSTDPSEQ